MQHLRIGGKISQIILREVEHFDQEKLDQYLEMDKRDGIILTVVYDNLSSRYNYENFVNGLEFFLEKYNFELYPPNTYLSEDIRFLKSTISHYRDNFYKEYTKLKNMNLEQYLQKLEKIYREVNQTEKVKKDMMKNYLVNFIKKYPNREDYNLFCIASGKEFIAKGMYLFGILPTYFVKLL